MPSETPSSPSIVTLLQTLRDDTMRLLNQELALAKAELKTNAADVGKHATEIATGGLVVFAGAVVLLIGLGQLLGLLLVRAGLDAALAVWLAPTLLGLLVGIIGWSMIARAKRGFEADSLTPKQTVQTLRDDKNWAQQKLNPSHETNS